MRIFQEEIFGPVVSVTTFKTDEDALSIANDTLYGLGAGVWSRDANRCYRFGRAIQAGRVWTNCYHAYPAHAAFGGYKQSGVVSFRTEGLTSKQVELALQTIPDLNKIGFLVNVASGVIIDRQQLESTCQRLGIKAVPAEVRLSKDLDAAFKSLAYEHVQGVIVLVDGMLFSERKSIAEPAARLPAIYAFRDHVDAGGLVSYRVNLSENFHRAAAYVNKILKGARPGDLPVEFPTKLELVVNNQAAKALRLSIPPSVLVRADEVIE
jgi:ABC-type uncharacterized transport system substrate-binding protein